MYLLFLFPDCVILLSFFVFISPLLMSEFCANVTRNNCVACSFLYD